MVLLPHFFGSGSKTARDTIQQLADKNLPLPLYKFEQQINPRQPVPSVLTKPTTLFKVFVDDFMAATNNLSTDSLLHKSFYLLHGVHSIFSPIEVTEHGDTDVIVEIKIDKGEGSWDYIKEILGWTFNGKDHTIALLPYKCDKILRRLKNIKRFKRRIP